MDAVIRDPIRSSIWNPILRVFGRLGVTTDFVWTVATTTSSETFTIPCQDVGVFDAVVDWGDGSTSAITAYNDADLAHVYASAGDHQIRISGTFPNIYFFGLGDCLKVKSVENLGVVGWLTFARAFYGCSNMTSFVAGNTDTSGVTSLLAGFYVCSSLVSSDLSGMNTSNVTDMNQTFYNNTSLLTSNVTGWDTSSVVTMFRCWMGCSSLVDLIGVEDLNIEGLNGTGDLTDIFRSSGIPTARYDALLINWDAQNPFDGMTPNFGSSTYTGGGAAAAARANLISTDGWTITDGGIA